MINFLKAISPKQWGIGLALAAIVFVMGSCMYIGIKADINRGRADRAHQIDRAAVEQSATKRAEQTIDQQKKKEALYEAIEQIPTSVVSERRLALACQRLRNDGHKQLPAECGPAAQGQAPTRP